MASNSKAVTGTAVMARSANEEKKKKESKGLAIQAFVCCNVHEVKARHFWLLEIHNRKPIWTFDSLEGVMPITQEVTKNSG